MSNQGTLHVTVIVEGTFDGAPSPESRSTLEGNGIRRNGIVWKKVQRFPARRLAEADFVQAAVRMTTPPQA